MFAEANGRDNLRYGVITTIEETLEMVGVVFVLRGLLEHLRDHIGPVTLGARADAARS